MAGKLTVTTTAPHAASATASARPQLNSTMNHARWKELDRIASFNYHWPPIGRFKTLLKMTERADEHPEWYNNPCFCRTCMSYADHERKAA